MDILIVDHNGSPIDPAQLPHLNLWTPVTEHICASTIARIRSSEESYTHGNLASEGANVIK